MKTISSIIALALAASVLPAFAQDAPPPAPNAPGHFEKGHRGPGGPFGEILESLTPAEREQYLAARKKAKDDPAVVDAKKKAEAARQAVADAVKAAMLKADPTIGPVIEKVEAAIKEKREEREERHEGAPLP
jgi:Spy/CpxP family protein refolding chaperone